MGQLHPQRHSPPLCRPTAQEVERSARRGPRSCASGRPSTPSSASCRASSRSPSPATRTGPRGGQGPRHRPDPAQGTRRAQIGFEVIVGGGQGRTPYVGPTIKSYLPSEHLLSYVEAILRVYNRHGRRDNIYKARIKILVAALGAGGVRASGRGGVGQDQPRARPTCRPANWPASAPPSPRPNFETPAGRVRRLRGRPRRQPGPAALRAQQRQRRTSSPATPSSRCSLKAIGQTPGDATAEQLERRRRPGRALQPGRPARHPRPEPGPAARQAGRPGRLCTRRWRRPNLATANIDLASDIIACPGLDYCALANARAIPIAQDIARKFADPDQAEKVGELKIKISGCINACGHHHVGPHRHPGRRQEGRGILPALARRLGGGGRQASARSSARACRPTRWPRPSTPWSTPI